MTDPCASTTEPLEARPPRRLRLARLRHTGMCRLAAAGSLALAACAGSPLLPYSADTPPLALVPASQAGVIDKRARFREVYCAVLRAREREVPDHRPCEEALVRVGGESAATGKAVDLGPSHRRLVAAVVPGIGYEWTGISHQEREAGGRAGLLYTVSILVVFLCLAALYESWSVPLAVLLVVPLGVLGTLVGAVLTWKMNDVYFQVGLLATIGLAAKNAVLIVEFARDLHAQGRGLVDAALEAARLRLRPIVMTSLAFILGVLPLMLATGAGAGAQNALGTAVVGGMVSGTVLAVVFVPLFFVVVSRVMGRRPSPVAPAVLEAH